MYEYQKVMMMGIEGKISEDGSSLYSGEEIDRRRLHLLLSCLQRPTPTQLFREWLGRRRAATSLGCSRGEGEQQQQQQQQQQQGSNSNRQWRISGGKKTGHSTRHRRAAHLVGASLCHFEKFSMSRVECRRGERDCRLDLAERNCVCA